MTTARRRRRRSTCSTWAAAKRARSPTPRAAPAVRSGRPTAGPSRSRPRPDKDPRRRSNDRKSDVKVDDQRRLPRQRQPRLGRYRTPLAHLHRSAFRRIRRTSRSATQLTDGEFDEGGMAWSPDGKTIYFVSTRVAEPYYEERGAELYGVPAAGGAITKIASIEGSIGNISLSPDGKRIAFVGSLRGKPIRSYSQPDLWVTDATPGSTPKNLTASYDFDIGGGIGGDQAAPRGRIANRLSGRPMARRSSSSSAEKGSSNLKRVTIATGKVDALTDGPQDVGAFSATPDASVIAAITVDADQHRRHLDHERADGRPGQGRARRHHPRQRRISSRTSRRASRRRSGTRASTADRSRAGSSSRRTSIPSKKYPLILEIHGGPHAAYGNVYTHEFQWMAAKGYVVLFTNPRGSTSYGQDFGNIIQYHYPGDDYKDLMAGVDEILKRGYVDREPARRHRRQRRRTADQLDDHADAALQGRGRRSATSPTGTASGSPPTSRCSSPPGSARRRGRIRRTSPRARRSPTSPTSRRR